MWSDIYDMILVYSAVPELRETRRSPAAANGLWLAGQAPVCHLGRKARRQWRNKRSIYRFVSCQTFIPFPVFLMPGQPASNLWQTQATRLAGYLLLGVVLALSLSKGTHWLCWIGLYCTVLYVERACVTNRSRSVRPFFLAIGL